eukprot:6077036-Amphidinium_carterae.1
MVANVLVDMRVLTKSKAWAGAVDDWKRFKFQLMSYISAVSPRLGDIMRKSATLDQPIRRVDLTPEDGVLDGQLSLEGRALDQLMNIQEGTGLETWRRFCHECEPNTLGHTRAHLVQYSDHTRPATFRRVGEQAGQVGDEHRSSETLENIKMGVLRKKRFVKGKGKDKGRKGKDKSGRGKGNGKEKTKNKEKERGEASTTNRFEGTCRWYGCKGHKKSQCHFKEAYTAQQKRAGQMAALSGSFEQELSSMEAVSSKRPLMDSGAAAHACRPQYAKRFGTECAADKEGVTYKNAFGGKVQRWGACRLNQTVQRSDSTDGAVTITYEAVDVARPIWSVGKCVTAGYAVWFTPTGSGMCAASMFEHSTHGPYIPLSIVHGVYEAPVQQPEAPEPADVSKQLQQEARSLDKFRFRRTGRAKLT